MFRKLLPVIAIAALGLAACSSPPAQSSAGSAGGPDVSQGKALFATNCGECHSDDGTGTDEAPNVAGHTAEQVKAQVRQPEGDMKAIGADKLSDADLEKIAAFVVSLPGAEAHPDIKPTDEEMIHLKAAFQAIEDHENMDRDAAITHLDQAAALASGDTAKLYEEMLEAVKAKKAGNARHELKELLGMEAEH
ncbi:MAG: cytochrome c [Chloroflexi bacterium]|nr:cytochrome c [Chloroflexota bacterium]